MRILFFGDSITDADRRRDTDEHMQSLGNGYVRAIAGLLKSEKPNGYEIVNRGISGHRIVDLYARVREDCWNVQPDVLSILIGINDIWHEIDWNKGVEIDRFEAVYRMLLADTMKRFPNLKVILCEPFVLEGSATQGEGRYERFLEVKNYAKVVKKLADEFGFAYLPLQEDFDKAAKQHGVAPYLFDGVHPAIAGAQLIADKWVALFKQEIEK